MRIRGAITPALVLLASACLAGGSPADASAAQNRAACEGRATTMKVRAGGTTIGTRHADVIRGSARGDRMLGKRAGDRLCGRRGRDRLLGGPAGDRIRGGIARDALKGNDGPDKLVAVDGYRDRVNCGRGRDVAIVDRKDVVKRCERSRRPDDTPHTMPGFALPAWSDGQWSDPSTYETIRAGDIDGDGREELVGRTPFGIEAHSFDAGTGQWLPLYAGASPGLDDADGWTAPRYWSTIQLADVDGDGADELLARAGDGLHAWRFQPSSKTWTELPVLGELSDAQGWSGRGYYSTIQAADLTGGAEEEVFARAPAGVLVWQLQGGSWQRLVSSGPFDDAGGGNQPQYYATIHAADFQGSGQALLYGRAGDGIRFYRLEGGAWQWDQDATLPEFGDGRGWGDPSAYSTIQTAVPFGPGSTLVFGRNDNGALGENYAPGASPLLLRDDAFSGGAWDQVEHYGSIQAADLDGDGRDEIIGRGPDGLYVYDIVPSQGILGLRQVGSVDEDFSDAAGWGYDRYALTFGTVGAGSGGRYLFARGAAGVQTMGLNPSTGSWLDVSAAFPTYTSGEAETAYTTISNALSGAGDLRGQYAEWSAEDFTNARITLGSVARPRTVSEGIWSQVKGQIDTELENGERVADWYMNYLLPIATEIFEIETMDDTAAAIELDVNRNTQITLQEWSLFSNLFNAMGRSLNAAFPGGGLAGGLIAGAVSGELGPHDVSAAIDGVTAAYIGVKSQLQGDFQAALRGIGNAREAINSDYGLQTAVGTGLIFDGRWMRMNADQQSAAEASAAHAYAVSIWQTLTPAAWSVILIADNDDANEYYCNQLQYCQYAVDGRSWTLAFGASPTGPGNAVPPAARNQLFGPVSSACQQQWQFASCNLGASVADVIDGAGGWRPLALNSWTCDADFFQVWSTDCQPGRR